MFNPGLFTVPHCLCNVGDTVYFTQPATNIRSVLDFLTEIPPTQACDLALLSAKGEVIKIQPVDMVPHAGYVENVALIQKIETN